MALQCRLIPASLNMQMQIDLSLHSIADNYKLLTNLVVPRRIPPDTHIRIMYIM